MKLRTLANAFRPKAKRQTLAEILGKLDIVAGNVEPDIRIHPRGSNGLRMVGRGYKRSKEKLGRAAQRSRMVRGKR